jgi:magnesium transporter
VERIGSVTSHIVVIHPIFISEGEDAPMIVDYALYQNGLRYKEASNLGELISKARTEGGFLWLGVAEPSEAEFPNVQAMVLKTAFYEEKGSLISTGEIICFIGNYFIVVVRHGSGAPLVNTRHKIEEAPEQLAKGPYAVLHAILDHVIDCYIDISIELENDVTQAEQKVFGETRESASYSY